MTLEQLVENARKAIDAIRDFPGPVEPRIEAIARVQERIDAATFALDEPEDVVEDDEPENIGLDEHLRGDDDDDDGEHHERSPYGN